MPATKRKRTYKRTYRRGHASLGRAIGNAIAGADDLKERRKNYQLAREKYDMNPAVNSSNQHKYLAKIPGTNRYITGYGAYGWGDAWRDFKKVGHDVMSAIPKGTFATVGSQFGPLGSLAGQGLAHITGYGDYNRLDEGQGAPTVINSSAEGMIVRHREYLCDVSGTTTQSIRKFPIQVGQSLTFPWLAQIAPHFQKYRLRGIVVTYKSTSASSQNGTNTALGQIVLSTQYDVMEEDPTTKFSMLQTEGSAACKPSEGMIHTIENDPAKGENYQDLYIREGALPAGGSLRDYDFANMYLGVFGTPAADINLGELWISYEVELIKSQLQSQTYGDWTDSVLFTLDQRVASPISSTLVAKNFTLFSGLTSDAGKTAASGYSNNNIGCLIGCGDTAAEGCVLVLGPQLASGIFRIEFDYSASVAYAAGGPTFWALHCEGVSSNLTILRQSCTPLLQQAAATGGRNMRFECIVRINSAPLRLTNVGDAAPQSNAYHTAHDSCLFICLGYVATLTGAPAEAFTPASTMFDAAARDVDVRINVTSINSTAQNLALTFGNNYANTWT